MICQSFSWPWPVLACTGRHVRLCYQSNDDGRANLVERSLDILRDDKALLGVESPLLLEVREVVLLKRLAVHMAGTLLSRAEADGGGDLNDRGAVLLVARVSDGISDASEVSIAVLDVLGVPAVRGVASKNILHITNVNSGTTNGEASAHLAERQVGLTVDRDVVVIVADTQISEWCVCGGASRTEQSTCQDQDGQQWSQPHC